MRNLTRALLALTFAVAAPAFATVTVSSPSNGETVGSSVNFVATANTTTCSKGVASMGIYVDNSLDYVVDAISLNKTLSLSSGTHKVVFQEWDFCGESTTTTRELTVSTAAGVAVTSPASGATVASPATYAATATTGCAKGVSSMGIYVDNVLKYQTQGSKLSTQLELGSGTHNTVVQEWDGCGNSSTKAVQVTVGGSKSYSQVQAATGWNKWGEMSPTDNVCAPCSGVNFSVAQHQSSISLSGNATKFSISGTKAYSDALFSNPVLGQGTTLGTPDRAHTFIPTLHNFTLDMYVYPTNLAITQSLEFDINMYIDSLGMEWGTQCNHLGDGDWDYWNNVEVHWISTGVACSLNNKAWNHVTIQVQRESNNDLLYQTITVNGVTHTINKTVTPFAVPSGWWGMTVNFQMDGNSKMASNTSYVDKMMFTYF